MQTLQLIHEDPATRLSLATLARHAKLSPSRFTALFKQATGVPVRRYKLWVAMGAAVRSMQRGASLTEASMEAGFSSPAHFSSAYRQMFGMEPSRLVWSCARTVALKQPAQIVRPASGSSNGEPAAVRCCGSENITVWPWVG